MLAYTLGVLLFAVGVAASIGLHEMGHLIPGKLFNVKVTQFFVGFGPTLWSTRRGETEYVIAALPLGGYVRMASRHDAETSFMEGGGETDGLKPGDAGFDPEAMMPFGPKPVPEHRWFESKSLVARLFIMIAGVTMNIILAFVVLTTLSLTYGEPVVATRVVGVVRALANAPALAALQQGDTILAVNGASVRSWSEIADRIDATPAGTLALRTQRQVVTVPIGTAGAPNASDVLSAVDFERSSVIGDVLPGSPAKRAGVLAGDTVVAIGGHPVRSWAQLQERVTPSAGVALPFQLRRAGQLVNLAVRPESTSEKDPVSGQMRTVGKIGASTADPTTRQAIGPVNALVVGARGTWITAGRVVGTVKGLITREVSVRQLGGPIAITRASVAAAQSGFESLFFLIALLSVNVAVLNLLPIPILDGGQILINVAESVKGSAFSSRTRENILRFGLAAILLIFVMSTLNDVLMGFKDVMARLFG